METIDALLRVVHMPGAMRVGKVSKLMGHQ